MKNDVTHIQMCADCQQRFSTFVHIVNKGSQPPPPFPHSYFMYVYTVAE